jgi:hypothetical protein
MCNEIVIGAGFLTGVMEDLIGFKSNPDYCRRVKALRWFNGLRLIENLHLIIPTHG